MKNLEALLITSAVLISAAENSAAISITEGVVDTASLSVGPVLPALEYSSAKA